MVAPQLPFVTAVAAPQAAAAEVVLALTRTGLCLVTANAESAAGAVRSMRGMTTSVPWVTLFLS